MADDREQVIMDSIPHALAVCDPGGKVCKCNAKWKEYFCHVTGESGWLDGVEESEAEVTRMMWEKHTNTSNADAAFEVTHRLRGGADELRWFRSHSNKIGDKEYLVTHTDIHNEVQLLQREEVFTRRVVHASDPVLTIDATDGSILSANQAVFTHLQYTPEELVGKSCTLIMDEKTASRHCSSNGHLMKFRRTVKPGYQTAVGTSQQTQAKRKDGTMIPITLLIDSYYKANAHIFIAVLRPITPELDMVQQINKTKDAFLANISHELRTPLFGLIGTLSLVRSRILDPITTEDTAQMELYCMNLLSLVNSMIDFYLLHFIHSKPVSLPFSIQKLVTNVCSRLKGFVRSGVTCSTSFSTALPQLIVSDPTLLEHIIINLLSNAFRFTPKGSVDVHVGLCAFPQERLSDLLPGQEVLEIKVTDTGIGIAPEFYPQVFQPFSQEDSSDTRMYKGAGLGLAIVKAMVTLLGGVVTFQSSLGHGTQFVVSLPVQFVPVPSPPLIPKQPSETSVQASSSCPEFRSQVTNIESKLAKASVSVSPILETPNERDKAEIVELNKRVLALEDDSMMHRIIQHMLGRLKCSVTIAANGQEGLDILFNSNHPKYVGYDNFDVIIADCQMPVMDGYVFTAKLREWERNNTSRHIKVIALTASISGEHEARCLNSGMDGYMAKPITVQALQSQLSVYFPDGGTSES